MRSPFSDFLHSLTRNDYRPLSDKVRLRRRLCFRDPVSLRTVQTVWLSFGLTDLVLLSKPLFVCPSLFVTTLSNSGLRFYVSEPPVKFLNQKMKPHSTFSDLPTLAPPQWTEDFLSETDGTPFLRHISVFILSLWSNLR